MKKYVWKYEVIRDKTIHQIPRGGIVRHVDNQFEKVCIWIEVDPNKSTEPRQFEVYDTGQLIHYDMGIDRKYLGTVKLQNDRTIVHVYEYIGV